MSQGLSVDSRGPADERLRNDERILIFAPAGRDAQLAFKVLDDARLPSTVCADVVGFCRELREGAAVGILTEEALPASTRAPLVAVLAGQPLWSDLPLIVLAGRPPSPEAGRHLTACLAELGNVTLLTRPLYPDALTTSVRVAVRARMRQYQARELLARLQAGVRERDQFLATLSHELRNPLGAIRNAMHLLRRKMPLREEDAAGDSITRPISIVDRQVTHLARLIDDLLDVARVTTGKVVLQCRAIDVREIIQHAVQQLEPTFEQSHLQLFSSLGTRALWTHGDPVRLEQVITNLLTNAIKYTPACGRVDVTAERIGDDIVVCVIDTGLGIEIEMLTSIFDLFSQADRSLDRAQGGMGIGLTLVRSLVELHGGSVTASSPGLGKGSEFVVRLPFRAPLATAGQAVVEAVSLEGAVGRRVLLVEDNDDNREMLRALLEMDGFQVDVAADGPQGVKQALSLKPEIAIVDIGLPSMDGYEVARRVRAELGTDIRLVALTGYGRPEDQHRITRAGFDAHLTKPVDLADLAAVLAPAG